MPVLIVILLALVGLFTSIVLNAFHTSEIAAVGWGVVILATVIAIPIVLLIIDGERQYRKKKREKEEKKNKAPEKK